MPPSGLSPSLRDLLPSDSPLREYVSGGLSQFSGGGYCTASAVPDGRCLWYCLAIIYGVTVEQLQEDVRLVAEELFDYALPPFCEQGASEPPAAREHPAQVRRLVTEAMWTSLAARLDKVKPESDEVAALQRIKEQCKNGPGVVKHYADALADKGVWCTDREVVLLNFRHTIAQQHGHGHTEYRDTVVFAFSAQNGASKPRREKPQVLTDKDFSALLSEDEKDEGPGEERGKKSKAEVVRTHRCRRKDRKLFAGVIAALHRAAEALHTVGKPPDKYIQTERPTSYRQYKKTRELLSSRSGQFLLFRDAFDEIALDEALDEARTHHKMKKEKKGNVSGEDEEDDEVEMDDIKEKEVKSVEVLNPEFAAMLQRSKTSLQVEQMDSLDSSSGPMDVSDSPMDVSSDSPMDVSSDSPMVKVHDAHNMRYNLPAHTPPPAPFPIFSSPNRSRSSLSPLGVPDTVIPSAVKGGAFPAASSVLAQALPTPHSLTTAPHSPKLDVAQGVGAAQPIPHSVSIIAPAPAAAAAAAAAATVSQAIPHGEHSGGALPPITPLDVLATMGDIDAVLERVVKEYPLGQLAEGRRSRSFQPDQKVRMDMAVKLDQESPVSCKMVEDAWRKMVELEDAANKIHTDRQPKEQAVLDQQREEAKAKKEADAAAKAAIQQQSMSSGQTASKKRVYSAVNLLFKESPSERAAKKRQIFAAAAEEKLEEADEEGSSLTRRSSSRGGNGNGNAKKDKDKKTPSSKKKKTALPPKSLASVEEKEVRILAEDHHQSTQVLDAYDDADPEL
jgi:hypothetical protein